MAQVEQQLGQKTPESGSKLKRIAEILKTVGSSMQDTQAGYWSTAPGERGKAARDYLTLRTPKPVEATGNMKDYQMYLKDEIARGNQKPLSFYEWDSSLRRAGASGQDTTDPTMIAIQKKIMGKINEKLEGTTSNTMKTPTLNTSTGTITSPAGSVDLGGGVKITFASNETNAEELNK